MPSVQSRSTRSPATPQAEHDSGKRPTGSIWNARVEPMLAVASSELPLAHEPYAFEFKWDGIRCIIYAEGGRARLESRNGNDLTSQYPELASIASALAGHEAVLDGEIVAMDKGGKPDFGTLQNRMNVSDAFSVRRRAAETPVTYYAFDLLFLDGVWFLEAPYEVRRERLMSLRLDGPHWRTPQYHIGIGKQVQDASRDAGLEGVVAKRLGSPYVPGARTPNWVKVKNRLRQEFVVGGWTRGEGSRSSSLGALLVGYYDADAKLTYAGRVGTGFNDESLRSLEGKLAAYEATQNPFERGDPGPGASFVRPLLVAEVEFAEWTHLDVLRQASFKGLRYDKDPATITRETPPTHKRR